MKDIIIHEKPKSPISEAYRTLRTGIQFANLDKNLRTILVTSATPGEGKTTTLANLAVAMAQNGANVLVMDCDMRKPRVHKVFEVSNKSGLADLLLLGDPWQTHVQHVEKVGLDVMTAGKIPASPSELLHSNAMKQLIETLKEHYDYIFMDAPPVVPVTDAVIMSTYLDGVLLVVASGQVEIELAKRAKESLLAVQANVIGVVLNKIPMDDPKAYQSYYYYYGASKKEEWDNSV